MSIQNENGMIRMLPSECLVFHTFCVRWELNFNFLYNFNTILMLGLTYVNYVKKFPFFNFIFIYLLFFRHASHINSPHTILRNIFFYYQANNLHNQGYLRRTFSLEIT